MKETAIKWLLEELNNGSHLTDKLIEKAKEMEKQQIIEAWENGYEHGACVNEDKNKYHGIQYYNETFNK